MPKSLTQKLDPVKGGRSLVLEEIASALGVLSAKLPEEAPRKRARR